MHHFFLFLFYIFRFYCYPTFTLNKYPTNAVKPIAIVPQNVNLTIALPILEPHVLATNAPNNIRKKRAKPKREYSILFNGKKSVTKRGNIPPKENAAPEASAACIGLA